MINKHLEYIPKGGMCAVCDYKTLDCSKLDFESMTKLGKGERDGLVVVRCIEFKRLAT